MNTYKQIIEKQREFLKRGDTLKIDYRINTLKKLKQIIKENENNIETALEKDLNKDPFETYFGELGGIYMEIDDHIKNLSKWSRDKRVSTPLALKPARSFIHSEPYGVTLIISPWNYPIQLAFMPLIGAISAGNTAIIKPSEISSSTSLLIEKIINENFDESYIHVINGGINETTELLKNRFDLIFFTGSVHVGKIIMKSASDHLTPVILELGGKSPAIVDKSARIDTSARRIAFGKITNCGQTCVAPDYVMVHKDIADEFIEQYKKAIDEFLEIRNGEITAEKLKPMVKFINKKNFERVKNLMAESKIIYGGKIFEDILKISPTITDEGTAEDILKIIDGKTEDIISPIMNEEIFGPVLPMILFDNLEQCIRIVNSWEKPLALYIFTENLDSQKKVIENVSFGGGCVNDTLVHLANPALPFGGAGSSGIGHYHGKYSFDAFSHQKSILKNPTFMDLKVRYMPYTEKKLKLLKKLFK